VGEALKDKVVLVTGAGNGIGRDLALLAAKEGAKVVVNDLGGAVDGQGQSHDPAQKVVDEIKAAGGTAVANFESVTDPAAAERMVEQAVKTFGKIDGVINNAGILRDRMFHKMSIDDWRSVVDVHLNGSFYVARAAATFFREQKSGAYVHFTSPTGTVGNVGQVNYGSAKSGIIGMSKCIALDMKAFNVRSNCICPFAFTRMIGTVPTETPEQKARFERAKQNTPAKIAPMTIYLLSDAAKDISGQIFGVRRNEIMLFSQPRPIRTIASPEGFSVEAIEKTVAPAMRKFLVPLDGNEYWAWDAI
jgi:NAD(P)-dependent dehydrogenase (short-subunit alcohol dehydrogenase family)